MVGHLGTPGVGAPGAGGHLRSRIASKSSRASFLLIGTAIGTVACGSAGPGDPGPGEFGAIEVRIFPALTRFVAAVEGPAQRRAVVDRNSCDTTGYSGPAEVCYRFTQLPTGDYTVRFEPHPGQSYVVAVDTVSVSLVGSSAHAELVAGDHAATYQIAPDGTLATGPWYLVEAGVSVVATSSGTIDVMAERDGYTWESSKGPVPRSWRQLRLYGARGSEVVERDTIWVLHDPSSGKYRKRIVWSALPVEAGQEIKLVGTLSGIRIKPASESRISAGPVSATVQVAGPPPQSIADTLWIQNLGLSPIQWWARPSEAVDDIDQDGPVDGRITLGSQRGTIEPGVRFVVPVTFSLNGDVFQTFRIHVGEEGRKTWQILTIRFYVPGS